MAIALLCTDNKAVLDFFQYGNKSFHRLKQFVSKAETNCFAVSLSPIDTSSSCRTSQWKQPKVPHFTVVPHIECIDVSLADVSIHCIIFWNTNNCADNVGMYRQMQNFLEEFY